MRKLILTLYILLSASAVNANTKDEASNVKTFYDSFLSQKSDVKFPFSTDKFFYRAIKAGYPVEHNTLQNMQLTILSCASSTPKLMMTNAYNGVSLYQILLSCPREKPDKQALNYINIEVGSDGVRNLMLWANAIPAPSPIPATPPVPIVRPNK